MSDISLQEAIDFFNVKAREARVLAKAEGVVAALQTAEGRIKEADAVAAAAKKEAARIIADANAKAVKEHEKLEALKMQVAEAEAKIPQAGEHAARVMAKAQEEAGRIKAQAEASAASIVASAQSKRAAHEQDEANARTRAKLAERDCAALEAQRADLEAAIATLKKNAKALAGV